MILNKTHQLMKSKRLGPNMIALCGSHYSKVTDPHSSFVSNGFLKMCYSVTHSCAPPPPDNVFKKTLNYHSEVHKKRNGTKLQYQKIHRTVYHLKLMPTQGMPCFHLQILNEICWNGSSISNATVLSWRCVKYFCFMSTKLNP